MGLPLVNNGDSGATARAKINAGLAASGGVPLATISTPGLVQPDGSSILITNSGIISTTSGSAFIINPLQLGAIADGGSHPLSTIYLSLAAAQAVYPFATSLSQELDYCAVQLAFYLAFGFPGSEHNVNTNLNLPIRLQAGFYYFGTDFIKVKNLRSGLIYGDGRFVTILNGVGQFVIQTNGCWYTDWRDFSVALNTNAGTTAFDLDGNILHDGSSLGIQGNTFYQMTFSTQLSPYAFYSLRQGGNFGQGDGCQYFNCYFQGASFACYRQDGFNNIHVNFFGGDTQAYTSFGHYHFDGWANYFSHSFETTDSTSQINNGGCDIFFNGSGGGGSCIYGCRTEGPLFINAQSVPVDVRNCVGGGAGGLAGWGANTSYPLGRMIALPSNAITFPDGIGRIFKVTTSGTSGGVQPNWPWQSPGLGVPNTIVDGGVTWTEVPIQWINTNNGTVDLNTTSTTIGQINFPRYKAVVGPGTVQVHTSNYVVTQYDDFVLVDATAGPVTISIPGNIVNVGAVSGLTQVFNRVLTIKKNDASANAVTIQLIAGTAGQADGFEGGITTDTIVGGSRGWRTYQFGQATGNAVPSIWYKIGTG